MVFHGGHQGLHSLWRAARVHTVIFLVLLLALWMLLAACAPSLQQAIVGTWRGPCNLSSASIEFQQAEFMANGTVILDDYAGNYSLLDSQRIKIQYGGLGFALTASTTQDTLTLTDYGGSACTLQRTSAT